MVFKRKHRHPDKEIAIGLTTLVVVLILVSVAFAIIYRYWKGKSDDATTPFEPSTPLNPPPRVIPE